VQQKELTRSNDYCRCRKHGRKHGKFVRELNLKVEGRASGQESQVVMVNFKGNAQRERWEEDQEGTCPGGGI